jgi:hypothetical protein
VLRVWYVAYGSNLGADRFGCYLAGGRPSEGARTYPGCRDRSPPAGSFGLELPGALVFAGESGVWGGGMAFYDPHGPGAVACRAYLVTAEQFADVTAQEMRLEPGGELAQAISAALPGIDELHRLGAGRYETLMRVDTRDGVPLLTITNGDLRELAPAPPSAPYLRSIAVGLRESHCWDDARIASYLALATGVGDAWTTAAVLEAIRQPPRERL